MRGKRLSGLTLVVVSLLLCLLSSPTISGEHPWDRDNGSGSNSGTTPIDTTVIRQTMPGSCGVAEPSPAVTRLSQPVLWPWGLMTRVTTWFYHSSFRATAPSDGKRDQDRFGRN